MITKIRSHRMAAQALHKKPEFSGWSTTDEQEIERRRLRVSTENLSVQELDVRGGFFGDFAVQSATGIRPYHVEIRSLLTLDNSCDCADFRNNGLGTCKHIEAVLSRLRGKGRKAVKKAMADGSPCVEIYLSRKGNPEIRVLWPQRTDSKTRNLLQPFFTSNGVLLAEPTASIPSLRRALDRAPVDIRSLVRISRDVEKWVEDLARRKARNEAREAFLNDVKEEKRSLEVVKAKLYPYQQEGMLHLAFNERALLADEMGLGKTVQAIAACELLRQTRHIERALVVSPASLKTEWEEQIAKFTGRPSRIIMGPRASRLGQYRDRSFFYLCNYEQVLTDVNDINELIAPDVVILDEAQRIKNWHTKTAKTIKRLSSPYAFVLTGTPLENRIDEVYSIAEFLDPNVFGPLFRFNREFYELDEKGRPIGYKNLGELHRRLRPIMLRRRKDEVEDQLPPRTVKNYFVGMETEQRKRYEEYSDRVARLLAITKRRSLTKEEFEKLQKFLACMRMICDTPFILDPQCRLCPKLSELAEILEEVMQSGTSKALIFSEWERMLHLTRDLAEEMKLKFAWHTGSVPQRQRREEINRFKQDPACRLFISTDSGATGLNLQAANIVINLDLPWNPAKLEQRIARAWRKHQTRSVEVINLVCEDSIEHRMVSMLVQKQRLADGVLDGRGDLDSLKMPSGKAAFLERLQGLMGGAAPKVPPRPESPKAVADAGGGDALERFRQDMLSRLDNRFLGLESHTQANGRCSVLAVVDDSPDRIKPIAERLLRECFDGAEEPPLLELVDRHTMEILQRLSQAGILKVETARARALYAAPSITSLVEDEKKRLRERARKLMAETSRKIKLSAHLQAGGFVVEALPILSEAVELALKALCCVAGEEREPPSEPVPLDLIEGPLTAKQLVAGDAAFFIARLRDSVKSVGTVAEEMTDSLMITGRRFMDNAEQAVTRFLLS